MRQLMDSRELLSKGDGWNTEPFVLTEDDKGEWTH